MASAPYVTPNQTRTLEHHNVFGSCGQGHGQRRSELSDAEFARRESAKHVPPRIVCERMKHSVHPDPMHNHMVEYLPSKTVCQPYG
jgi:hypothetical protein